MCHARWCTWSIRTRVRMVFINVATVDASHASAVTRTMLPSSMQTFCTPGSWESLAVRVSGLPFCRPLTLWIGCMYNLVHIKQPQPHTYDMGTVVMALHVTVRDLGSIRVGWCMVLNAAIIHTQELAAAAVCEVYTRLTPACVCLHTNCTRLQKPLKERAQPRSLFLKPRQEPLKPCVSTQRLQVGVVAQLCKVCIPVVWG